MAKTLLVIVVFLAVTVTQAGAEVTLPFDKRTAQQDRSISIKCTVTNETFVAWITPSGQTITTDPQTHSVKLSISQTGDDYTLKITDVSDKDGGKYTCQGINQAKVFTLEVDFVSQNVDLLQKLKIGEKGTIKLDVSAYPKLVYEWTKDGKPITFSSPERELDLSTGTITITTVAKSDQGNYSCRVVWKRNTAEESEDTVNIQVIVTEKPRIKKPLGDPVTKTLTAGFNVTFHCDVVAGSPKPTITWYFKWTDTAKKVDKQYDDRYSHPNEESWTITDIEKKDEGKYRCIAENEAGQATLRVDIQKVNVPPTIDQFPQNVYDEGDKVDFECKASGDPKPTVEWRKDGYPFPKQTTKTEGEKVVTTITFNKITLEDTGEYTCVAFNDALDDDGEVIVRKKTANLHVNSPPKINEVASVTPVYSFVRYPKAVTVKCVFYGYPIPTVKMVAPNGTEVATGPSKASVTLTTDSVDDFGLYNCSAENEDNEKAEFSIELRIAVPPGPPSNVSVITTCNTIKLQWNPPKDNGGMPVETYVITATGPNVSHTENVTPDLDEKVLDPTFQPSTDYKITIKATTAAGPGDLVELQPPVTTKQYCKPGRPSITNTDRSIEGTSFTLTWAPPIYDGGDPILQYKVKWAKKPITEDTKWEESDGLVDGTSLEITDLSPDTEYEFHVYARNQEGFGEPAITPFKVEPGAVGTTGSSSASPTTAASLHSTLTSPLSVSALHTTAASTGTPTDHTSPIANEPTVGARTDPGLGSGAIAGIVIAVILIVLITIDLFCCFFNSCGVIFCCHKALCGAAGGGGGGGEKSDYMDGKKVPATEMEKQPLPQNV